MKIVKAVTLVAMGCVLVGLTACDGERWTEKQVDSFMLVTQKGGPALGYSPQSGVPYALLPTATTVPSALRPTV